MGPFVLDASAAVDMLLGSRQGRKIAERMYAEGAQAHSPNLIWLEVVQVLRNFRRQAAVDSAMFDTAFDVWRGLRIYGYPPNEHLERVWALKDRFTAYDAAYVALAESLDVPLVTSDERLGRACASLIRCEIFANDVH